MRAAEAIYCAGKRSFIQQEYQKCYRVVNSKGELSGAFAFGGADRQEDLLKADGIEVVNGKVDLKVYGMKF